MAAQGLAPRRIAVVLFNLGGPDQPRSVRPFLFNLFSDPAILNIPPLVRYPLAALISTTRSRSAKANYDRMGGASPLLAETRAQAVALETMLAGQTTDTVKVFIAMRYWAPNSAETARAVAAFAPDEVVLLPLYPQYSTTTTASSLKAWSKAYSGSGRTRSICCYPLQVGLIDAHACKIEAAWEAAGHPEGVRLLFSAHGLPEQVIEAGDPYRAQVEATAAAVAARLRPGWDWQVCYQSRVGPLKWLGPSTLEAIETAAGEGLGVVVTPIAFVSEHVETLVELDHDYAMFAEKVGSPHYIRVPALGVQAEFIAGLAQIVMACLDGEEGVRRGSAYACPAQWGGCPVRKGEKAA